MRIRKILLSLMAVTIIGSTCALPAKADTVRSLEKSTLLPFGILTDIGLTALFPIGVKQDVGVHLYNYSSYKKVTEIDSFSYFDNSSIDYGVTGPIEIHNDYIYMSNINEQPLIHLPRSASWNEPTWVLDNAYVTPGSGSTYSFPSSISIEADGFVWMPSAEAPGLNFSLSGSVT